MLFTDRVTILRPGRRPGEYGGTVDDWDAATEVPVPFGVSVQPRSASSDVDPARHTLLSGHVLITQPPHLLDTLRETDRVRVDTQPGRDGRPLVFDVVGDPDRQHFRTPVLPHSEIGIEARNG